MVADWTYTGLEKVSSHQQDALIDGLFNDLQFMAALMHMVFLLKSSLCLYSSSCIFVLLVTNDDKPHHFTQ